MKYNTDCEAYRFYEPGEELKTHGCLLTILCACGALRCRHWKYCPRCVKRERDKFLAALKYIHESSHVADVDKPKAK